MPAPLRTPFHGSLRPAILALVVVLCAAVLGVAAPAAERPSAEDDLKALQGTWERTQVLPEQPGEPGARSGRVVKVVTGNRETVTTYDAAGKVTYAHSVQFRLERQGKVRVFTFFNREVTAGSTKGQKVAEPSSYIYRLSGDTFEEVWGFLPGQEKRDLLAAKWKRAQRA